MQPLHYDSSTSMLAQLRGRKRIKLYKSTPEVFRAMKLFPNSSPHRRRGAVRDLEESDIDDGDDALKPYVVDLEKGDVLFWPPKWPHHVSSLGSAVSVSVTSRFAVPHWRAPRTLEEVRRRKLALPIHELRCASGGPGGGRFDDPQWASIVKRVCAATLDTVGQTRVDSIFVRGSLANGSATPFVSDVDMLVVLGGADGSSQNGNGEMRHLQSILHARVKDAHVGTVATKVDMRVLALSGMSTEDASILADEGECVWQSASSSLVDRLVLLRASATTHRETARQRSYVGADTMERLEHGMYILRAGLGVRQQGGEKRTKRRTRRYESDEDERIAKWCLKRSLRAAHESVYDTCDRCLFTCAEKLVGVYGTSERDVAAALVAAVRGPSAAWGEAWRSDCIHIVEMLMRLCFAESNSIDNQLGTG